MSILDVWVAFLVLGTLAVFFAGVWVLVRIARRHAEDDSRAMAKVAIAIVFSLLLGAGSFLVLYQFQAKGVEGVHTTLSSALNRTIGESDYIEAGKTITSKTKTAIPIILTKLHDVNATLDGYFAAHPEQNASFAGLPANIQENLTARSDTLTALTGAQKDLHDAIVKQRTLGPNHALWLKVSPLLKEGHDEEAEALVGKALDPAHVADADVLPLNAATAANNEAPCVRDAKEGFCTEPLVAKPIEHSFFDAHEVRNIPVEEGGPAAFEHQREFNEQMDTQLKVFAYSSVTGIMLAPFVFAGGAILRRAFVPSDTVGFKPYPSKSAGWFLLLGAFGVFAIPFSAWALRDLHKRSVEGQISL